MKLTIKTKLILFTLGEYYKEANKKLKKKNLQILLSKTDFIAILQKAGITQKQPRAIYKNLENLEKKKFIQYYNKNLIFTEKGIKYFKTIDEELKPYLKIFKIIKTKKVTKFAKKPQTVFLSKLKKYF